MLREFYIFKLNAKNSLLPSVFEDLKEFLDSGIGKPEPTYKFTANQFIVSFEPEEELELEEIVNLEDDDRSNYIDDEVTMAVDEETESYYEMETVNDESETALTDQDDKVKPIKQDIIDTHQFEIIENENETYQCECGVLLLSLNELQRHRNQHKRSISNSKLICCEVGFKDVKCYELHQKAHENFDAIAPHLQSFVCSHCRIMYSNEDDLLTHNAQHEDDSELEETIMIERRSAFDDHMLKQIDMPVKVEDDDEDDVELFSCGHCGKKQGEVNLKVHLLFFHTHIVFCPLDNRCFEGSKQVRSFSDHIRNKHPEIFDKNNLYTCRHCDQSFTTNFEKLAHMKKCDAKLFACESHCNKRFATEWLLKNHMKYIFGENRFSCEVCEKRCVSKSDLQIHSRSHTNERPYSCPICKKSFKTSANRSSHLDIHESEKRHECEVCGKLIIEHLFELLNNDSILRRKVSNSSDFAQAQEKARREVPNRMHL